MRVELNMINEKANLRLLNFMPVIFKGDMIGLKMNITNRK